MRELTEKDKLEIARLEGFSDGWHTARVELFGQVISEVLTGPLSTLQKRLELVFGIGSNSDHEQNNEK